MKPPKRQKTDFERVPKYDEWIEGIILDIQYDAEHKRTFNGEDKIGPAVRFKFELKDCKFPKFSRWLTFSYADKANLYKKFISNLVDGAEPDMDFDIDLLKGFEIKTMWKQDGEYDNLELIRPLGKPFGAEPEKTLTSREAAQAMNPQVSDEEVPF